MFTADRFLFLGSNRETTKKNNYIWEEFGGNWVNWEWIGIGRRNFQAKQVLVITRRGQLSLGLATRDQPRRFTPFLDILCTFIVFNGKLYTQKIFAHSAVFTCNTEIHYYRGNFTFHFSHFHFIAAAFSRKRRKGRATQTPYVCALPQHYQHSINNTPSSPP